MEDHGDTKLGEPLERNKESLDLGGEVCSSNWSSTAVLHPHPHAFEGVHEPIGAELEAVLWQDEVETEVLAQTGENRPRRSCARRRRL